MQGIKLNGRKEVLGIWIVGNESAKYWLCVLNEIKNRGVEDIMIVSVDDLLDLEMQSMQYSLRQKSRGVSCIRCYTTKFVNYKDLKPFVKDLKEVYQAATEKLALTSCITSYVVSVRQTRDLPVG